MKKFAMLILLGVFATASVSACSKDKKDDDKAGDKAKDDDKAADDKKGDTAAKGADTDTKAEGSAAMADRNATKGDTADGTDEAKTPDEPPGEDGTDEDKKPAGDVSFDAAFVKQAMDGFEGFVEIMENNKDDCAKMASEIEAYMQKLGHVKKKMDAIEADPVASKKWKEATGKKQDEIQARMMPALEKCVQDPAMEAVFKKMAE